MKGTRQKLNKKHFLDFRLSIIVFFCLLLFSGCPSVGPTVGVDLHLMQDDLDRESIRRAIHQSLKFLANVPEDREVGEWPRKFTAEEVKESLVAFMNLIDRVDGPESLPEAIRSNFDLVESDDASGENVLFTGYYQPMIEGSLKETAEYPYPIYGRPANLVEARLESFRDHFRGDLGTAISRERILGRVEGSRLIPYFSRREIEVLGRLKGKGYEIAWAKDPIDLFFLHIQGSGLLRLQDGRLLQINYAASNGRPYTSIGKILLDQGKIPDKELSMQRLRRYLRDHPEEQETILSANERYIFFRIVKEGPIGNLGVALTPGRSIATDVRFLPKGALAFIVTKRPILDEAGNLVGWEPFSRFVLNQDTGNSIRGRGRVDLYFGAGPEAAAAAGFMKSTGKLYFLMKKEL